MKHWTEEHMDRLEKAEKLLGVAYKALLEMDGTGFCCRAEKSGCHADNCLAVEAVKAIRIMQKNLLPGEKKL